MGLRERFNLQERMAEFRKNTETPEVPLTKMERQRKWHADHPGYMEKWNAEHPGYASKASRAYAHGLKLKLITLFGGKCAECNITDWRVLELNHLNGNRKDDIEKYKSLAKLYRAVLNGERTTEDLNLLCANCNVIHEYKTGNRQEMFE